jgi:thiol-disulfide isomerase/thioredoxin
MSFRIPAFFIIPSMLCLGIVGCTNEGASPTGSATTSDSENSGTNSAPELIDSAGVGDEQAPDGNSEPPLADVTSAVDSLPSADAANITLTTVTPQQFDATIAKHKGKVVFVDFWATWCPACMLKFPHTVALAAKHPDDLVVISMSFDDEEAQADALVFLKKQKATFENLACSFGGSGESFSSYKIESGSLPYFRLYNRQGKLIKAFENDVDAGIPIDDAEVDKAIEAAVAAAK